MGLATQVAAGRHLRVLDQSGPRLRVRLHEDGYPCWLDPEDLERAGCPAVLPALPRLDRAAIAARLADVLAFGEAARLRPNHYLWGGTLGPDLDCSGLVQTTFLARGITLPRDAAQQAERGESVEPRDQRPGDLLFFSEHGDGISHVAIAAGGDTLVHSTLACGGLVREAWGPGTRAMVLRTQLVAVRRLE